MIENGYNQDLKTRDSALMGAMVESAVDGIIVTNEQGIIEMINSAAERMFRYSMDEVIGHNVSMLMPEPYRSEHDNYIASYLHSGVRKIIGTGREVTGLRKDGSIFPLYLSIGEVRYGERRLFTGIAQDLTERKQAQEQIERLQHRQKLILDAVGEGIIGLDIAGRISFANPAAVAMLGWSEDRLIGKPLHEIWSQSEPKDYPGYRVLKDGIECRGEDGIFVNRAGYRFPVEYSGKPIQEAERVVGVVISFQDITERQHTDREMQRMRSYLKSIIDSMPSILIGVDTEGRVTEWNQGAERASGMSQATAQGRLFTEPFPYLESQLERVHEAIRNQAPMRNERLVFEADGHNRYADVIVYPLESNGILGAVIRVDDVTNRVHIEQMMVQTEKMMSVGGLAAGMAHEINNPLSTVLQGCQNILRRLSSELPANQGVAEELGIDLAVIRSYLERRGILRFLEGIQDAGARATHIVIDMLAFSRRSSVEFIPAQVDDMLNTVIRLAASDYDLKKNYDFRQIEIVREYDPELGRIYCDRNEIEQVLLNLIRNAAQAMTDSDSSTFPCITMRTRTDGDNAYIEVEDNGPGMDETTARRIFEPFFTTKPAGVGTGLGLSVSYFIVTEQHQGDITVSSTLGQGTCFTIRLPLKPKEARG